MTADLPPSDPRPGADPGAGLPAAVASASERDAAAVLARIEADEAAAEAARAHYRRAGSRPIETAPELDGALGPAESLLAWRTTAIVQQVHGGQPGHRGQQVDGLELLNETHGAGGPLVLTSSRLMHLSRVPQTRALEEIVELTVTGERLLVSFRSGGGWNVQVNEPRLLRVHIAAALAAVRDSR